MLVDTTAKLPSFAVPYLTAVSSINGTEERWVGGGVGMPFKVKNKSTGITLVMSK